MCSYQGSEKEPETNGGAYSTDYRILDTRIGRWFNADPIKKHWESPYAGFANNPIYFVDPSGLDAEGKSWWQRTFGKKKSKKDDKLASEEGETVLDEVEIIFKKKRKSPGEVIDAALKKHKISKKGPGFWKSIGMAIGSWLRSADKWLDKWKGSRAEWPGGVQINTKDLNKGGSTSDLPFVKPENWDNVVDIDWDQISELADMFDKANTVKEWTEAYLKYRKILFRLNSGKFKDKKISTFHVLKMQKALFYRKVAKQVLRDVVKDAIDIEGGVSEGISRGYYHEVEESDSALYKVYNTKGGYETFYGPSKNYGSNGRRVSPEEREYIERNGKSKYE